MTGRSLAAVLVLLLSATVCAGQEHSQAKAARMRWFQDARLGIFVHWGIYAVNGIDESWSFFNGYISHDDYMKQLAGFTASAYDPAVWAALIRDSGARYAVLTSKHHDGVALWDSPSGELNVAKRTPAKRDLVGPLCDALRKLGIRVGLYYSLLDWSHPDYPNLTSKVRRYTDDPARWERFRSFNFAQLRELSGRYNPDLWWFDGDWEQSAEKWDAAGIRRMLLERNPATILNSRLQGYGDYLTPEQGVPVLAPSSPWWELCMTMNDSWGFQGNDRNYKTPNQVIRIFIDCLRLGGNLLLDIGPRADGTIPNEQVSILRELGRWTKKHQEAIYGSEAGIPLDHFYGPTTLSADRKVLYLFLDSRPVGPVVLRGLSNPVQRIRVVGEGTKLSWKTAGKQYWSDTPGILYIDVPEKVLDPQVTVLAVQLDGPVLLYRK